MPIMRIFIVFALISFTQIFCAPSEQQQFELFAEEIREWDEMRPLELVWNVEEMIELLQGEHTLSMQRSDKMWLAIDITSHFLRKDDPAELFDCITTIRDPTKLCPLWAFVNAMLSRLSADFVTIRGSQKWHSDVALALMHLDAEFSDVALTKRDINKQNKYCTKWHGSEEFKRLANLIHIDWETDGDTIPEFLLNCIQNNLIHFLHENALSISDQIDLVEHIATGQQFKHILRTSQTNEMPQSLENFEYDQLIKSLKSRNLQKLTLLFGANAVELYGTDHFLTKDEFFKNLLEFLAKITNFKILLKNIEDIKRSNIMRNENDLAEYVPKSWQEMSKYWHAKLILNKKLREIRSLHFVKELYAFALRLSWLLEFARPRGQIKTRLNCLADQKWPSRMEFHEKFSNLVSQFSEHLHNEMPQIALEKHLLRSTDICKAWLYWYYEQQQGTTTETLPLDDADVEFQCKNKQN